MHRLIFAGLFWLGFVASVQGAPDLNAVRKSITNVDTKTLKKDLAANPNIFLIDVRTVRETNIVDGTRQLFVFKAG